MNDRKTNDKVGLLHSSFYFFKKKCQAITLESLDRQPKAPNEQYIDVIIDNTRLTLQQVQPTLDCKSWRQTLH